MHPSNGVPKALRTALRVAAMFALVAGLVQAHHPFSTTYDASKSGILAGTVAKVQWTNPHVVLALDVVRADGVTERWMVEGYPPNTLRRTGWETNTLREGMRITISGWHARDSALKIFHGREITLETGTKLVFGTTPEGGDAWRCRSGDCPPWIPSIPE